MSTTDPGQVRPTVRQYSPSADASYAGDDSGYGWVLFAGVLLAMLATLNFIDGVAAVSNSSFFVGDAKFILSGLNTWGWVLIVISAVQLVTAFGVWAQWTGVRWVGVAIAALNAIVQLTFMPAYPLWSLCLFTLDILVIYGLVAHGARRSA
jgi:hypothetical protein